MIVEDDPSHVMLIKAVFAHFDANAHISVTRSAEEAIACVRGPWPDADFGNRELPDVIVLDINMAGIGGLGFLEWYADEPGIAHVPVVVFTSSDGPDLRQQCFALGAREFKVKPADFRELVPVVHRVLNHWELEEEQKLG